MRRAPIGIIGLGALGRPIAERLLAGGFPVIVYNRTASKAAPLGNQGARIATTPAEAARASEVLITVLGDDRALEAVCLGSSGTTNALRPGSTHFEMSTSSSEMTKRLSTAVEAAGADFLDAPVLGSGPQAVEGTLVLMIGGDKAVLQKRSEILQTLGKKIIHTGAVGSASHLKLVANQFIVSMILGFAQGMTLARKGGLSADLVMDVIEASALTSPFYRGKLRRIESRDYSPNFPSKQMLKDIDLLLDAGSKLGVPLPGVAAARKVYLSAIEQGLAEQDYSIIIESLAREAGLNQGPR